MKVNTLTWRLFLRVSPVILVAIGMMGYLAFHSATYQINHVYDAQLINNTGVLWSLTKRDIENGKTFASQKVDYDSDDLDKNHSFILNKHADDYETARMMRIWKNGKIILSSDTAFPSNVRVSAGFSYVDYKGGRWRVFSLPITGHHVSIEVGEKISLRDDLVLGILSNILVPLLFLVPLIGFLIWFGIGNGLQVIRDLVQQIKNRSPEDLSSVDIATLPRDLEPLGLSINHLLTKLEKSLTAERRFSDHAAHQLRTPLAGLKLRLQMLAKSKDGRHKPEDIENMLTSIDRAIKLVEQLLGIVRVGHQPLDMKPLLIYPLTASIIAEMGPLITARGMRVSLAGDENASVVADEYLLRIAITNLFENALKYTPDGGRINLDIRREIDMCLLSLEDSGSGISDEHKKSVFNRFYRGAAAHTVDGAGLGLSIVSEIMNRLSGKILLKDAKAGQGLLVEVFIPAA